jgi:hypothetical protein
LSDGIGFLFWQVDLCLDRVPDATDDDGSGNGDGHDAIPSTLLYYGTVVVNTAGSDVDVKPGRSAQDGTSYVTPAAAVPGRVISVLTL